jgi:hypothetical protein
MITVQVREIVPRNVVVGNDVRDLLSHRKYLPYKELWNLVRRRLSTFIFSHLQSWYL